MTKTKTKKPRTMLLSVPHDVAENFRRVVTRLHGPRQMSPLIVAWMRQFVAENGK